ncbi:MAG: hypothetical protein EBR99_04125 [Actinobacteria bacterium]|nr:hypothetical protein [Actinomycetota bacterium]
MTITYHCPNCDAPNEVECTAGVEAQTYGPPEKCYPAEPPEIDPGACCACGHEFELDKVFEELPEPDYDHDRDDRDDAAEDARNWADDN